MIRSYSSLLFWLGMTILASVMLYHTSDRVNALDQQLHKLNAQIEDERKSLHVLKAEWVYLNNPERIEVEAKRHLGLQPTTPTRIADIKNMNDLLPLQNGTQVQLASAAAQPSAEKAVVQTTQTPTPDKPRNEHDRLIASVNAGRINDHMTMQHSTLKAEVSGKVSPDVSGVALALARSEPDRIGALIGKLGLRQ